MGILKRVVDMTKAAANEVLDKMENPIVMMNHYLRDLDENIAKAEQGLVQQQVQERVLLAKNNELNNQAAYYESKAEEAAVGGREAEARAALEAMLLYREQAEEAAKLAHYAKSAALDLEQQIEAMKEEKTKLHSKREELAARVRRTSHAAEAGSYSQAPYHLQGGAASRGFERIEQKVMELEAQQELAKAYPRTHSAFAADPKQEQRNAAVEEELQRLLQKKSGE